VTVSTLARRLDTRLSDIVWGWGCISETDRPIPTSSRPAQLSPPSTTFTSSMTATKPMVASSSHTPSLIAGSLPHNSTAVDLSARPNTTQSVLCECGLPALVQTNKSGTVSVGRNFVKCSRGSCGFWKWADDVESSISEVSSNVIIPVKRTYTQVCSHVFTVEYWRNIDRCYGRRIMIQRNLQESANAV